MAEGVKKSIAGGESRRRLRRFALWSAMVTKMTEASGYSRVRRPDTVKRKYSQKEVR